MMEVLEELSVTNRNKRGFDATLQVSDVFEFSGDIAHLLGKNLQIAHIRDDDVGSFVFFAHGYCLFKKVSKVIGDCRRQHKRIRFRDEMRRGNRVRRCRA